MVLALRLGKRQERHLATVCRRSHMNKSDAAKDLLERGYLSYQLDDFKSGRTSLGKLAQNLQVPLAEALGLVARFNAHPEMPKDLLAEGWETARQLTGA